MKNLLLLLVIFLSFTTLFAQNPKREFRGAWIATVANIDWPSTVGNSEVQKQQLITLLDDLKKVNVNAVFFQVRPECDALYQSKYEPWSKWLTGRQGVAPSPFYDPLQFAIEEAHKRGMELHAWFNPYRAEKTVNEYTLSSNHISKTHPEWIITQGSLKYLNPGLPQVKEYVTNVIMDVVRNYKVDGVHFDDYFYHDGVSTEDAAAYAAYNPKNLSLGDWRRENVNTMVRMVNDSVANFDNSIKFGISPRGIWRSGYPAGTSGNDNYNAIYTDATYWMRNKIIDYIAPQLYWKIGGAQDYLKLSAWWADSAAKYDVHNYPGQAIYRMGTSSFGPLSEIVNQVNIDRANPKIQGQIYYSSKFFSSNFYNITDTFSTNYHKNPALPYGYKDKDQIAPNMAENVRFDRVSNQPIYGITWNLPLTASDNDTAFMYVVYNFDTPNPSNSDFEDNKNIVDITANKFYLPKISDKKYFSIRAVDKNWNEGFQSTTKEVLPVQMPVISSPVNLAQDQRDTVLLKWNVAVNSSSYQVQVAEDAAFTKLLQNEVTYLDTVLSFTKVSGQKTYYWRVKAKNSIGESEFTSVHEFKTGFPKVPVLAYPLHATSEVDPVAVTLKWNKEVSTASYQFQIGTNINFTTGTIIYEVNNYTDTILVLPINLEGNKVYYWRVRAANQFGTSSFNYPPFAFKTKIISDVEDVNILPTEYSLYQNYPNPFNPITNIRYALPESGYLTIRLYDILGQNLGIIHQGFKQAGVYSFDFNAESLSSGNYLYTLEVNGRVISKKLTLLK